VATSVSCPSTSFCAASDLAANILNLRRDHVGPIKAVPVSPPAATAHLVCFAHLRVAVDSSKWRQATTAHLEHAGIDRHGHEPVTSLVVRPSFCVAVDNAGNRDHLQRIRLERGQRWTPPPLTSVSCTSSSFLRRGRRRGEAVFYTGTWATVPIDGATSSLGLLRLVQLLRSSDNAGNAAVYTGTWASPVSVDWTASSPRSGVPRPLLRSC